MHNHHDRMRFLFEHILEPSDIGITANHLIDLGLAAFRLVVDIITGDKLSLMNFLNRFKLHCYTPCIVS